MGGNPRHLGSRVLILAAPIDRFQVVGAHSQILGLIHNRVFHGPGSTSEDDESASLPLSSAMRGAR